MAKNICSSFFGFLENNKNVAFLLILKQKIVKKLLDHVKNLFSLFFEQKLFAVLLVCFCFSMLILFVQSKPHTTRAWQKKTSDLESTFTFVFAQKFDNWKHVSCVTIEKRLQLPFGHCSNSCANTRMKVCSCTLVWTMIVAWICPSLFCVEKSAFPFYSYFSNYSFTYVHLIITLFILVRPSHLDQNCVF